MSLLDRFPEVLNKDGGTDSTDGSVFYRYITSHQEEIDVYSENLEQAEISRQVDRATGRDLDRIGKIFGTLGRRAGREDDEYSIYLQNIVAMFTGRGTKLAIREAVAGALDISVEDVGLRENFDRVEYDVILYDWPRHEVLTVEEVAEIADPSGVAHNLTRYHISPEPTITGDDVWLSDEIWVAWDSGEWDDMHWASSTEFLFGYGISPYGSSYGDPVDLFPGSVGYEGSEYESSPYGS